MTAQILDGKALAETIRNELTEAVAQFIQTTGIQPGLAVILVGEDPASQVYVRNKIKACEEVGMQSIHHRLPAETTQDELLQLIDQLNADPSVHGILVQLPVPKQIDALTVLERVNPLKDVDGFHPINVGRLSIGQDCLVPCTPLGVIEILKRAGIPLKGQNAVIVGRSNIVGKPMIQLLLKEHATVTVCHSRTQDLPGVCRSADILIAATGQKKMVKGSWIKPGAAVIDVGISFEEIDGKWKQCGDVEKDEALQVAGYLSPSPGGPGPMTIAMLLSNTLKAAQMQNA
ncbi:MAG: bifunctional methylenetetrahydrofolate dehydrogenase/methenyltetrahydrofolate cyclohydrolase FolD [bacterium]|jgi:methylenetetrahydrofolate dehydrogenase (NADP+)/methenyltetrahydrofolate cyclohydrolase|nr:bifunctional methylenetetrahydrofolate dehydrogenase/methenyltetrahydrofolate cyclohydrolase FolD [bacterium]